LPPSFFTPGTCLLTSASGARSAAQPCADLYISQNAVLAETGAAAPLPAPASSRPGLGASRQELTTRTRTSAATSRRSLRMLDIPREVAIPPNSIKGLAEMPPNNAFECGRLPFTRHRRLFTAI